MPVSNTRQRYGLVAQILHWVAALLILALIGLGIFMTRLSIDTDAQIQSKFWFYSLHKTLGIAAFFVAVLRVAWAMVQTKPAPIHPEKKLETFAAETVYWLLYASMIIMPLSGWIHHAALDGFAPIWWPLSQDLFFIQKSQGIANVFGTLHHLAAKLFILSIVLHIGGALKHTFIDRDVTLKRMIPNAKFSFPNNLKANSKFGQSKSKKPFLMASILICLLLSLVGFLQLSSGSKNIELTGLANTESNWIVNTETSKLNISIIQSGKAVEGEFKQWDALISFDPKNLDKASVLASIATSSLQLGGVTQQALGKDFLNELDHPLAEFKATGFKQQTNGQYLASGTLSLAGTTQPFDLVFDLEITGDKAIVKSASSLKRLDFGVGAKGFADDGTLGFHVQINLFLEADRQSS